MSPPKDEPVSTVAEKEEKMGKKSVSSVCCAGCEKMDEQVKKQGLHATTWKKKKT
jgi:hypothetical protein